MKAVKFGDKKLLITVESIRRFIESLPRFEPMAGSEGDLDPDEDDPERP